MWYHAIIKSLGSAILGDFVTFVYNFTPSKLIIIVRVFVYLITVSVYLHDFSLVLVSIGNWKYVSETLRSV